ncbi:iron uptake transporter permease EfeU [Propionicicella superfundia]|uniref:iron uptake transporter permease EfeU n=1 Tax=Propionicicella superfundia TaxID=348582 RepID=UPI0003FC126A|nr:iron uptake transporter permease EfeU [Propionicicella superfundia]
MLATFVIGLREGLEAALIVGIIAAFLRKNGRSLTPMAIGVAAAVALSLAVGVALQLIEASLPQAAQEGMETVIGVVAVVFVTGMVLWMSTHARGMKKELEASASEALGAGSTRALVVMAFLAVLKEGFETAVFLLATFSASTNPVAAAAGAVLGILAAAAVGYGLYSGGLRLNLGRFFTITSGFLVLVAAGLVVSALGSAHEAGWLDAGQQKTVDLSWLAPNGSVRGSLFTGVLGIPPDPRLIQVVGWLAYVVPMSLYLFWPRGHRPSAAAGVRIRAGVAAVLGVAAVVLAAVVGPATMPALGAAELVDDAGASVGSVALEDGAARIVAAGASEVMELSGGTTVAHAGVPDAVEYALTLDVPVSGLPSTLTLAQLAELNGGRLPVGVSPQQAPGPFTATWARTGERRLWLAGGEILDLAETDVTTVTLTGGGLATSRTFTVAGDVPGGAAVSGGTLAVPDDRVGAAASAAATLRADVVERRFWGRTLPMLLAVAALVVLFTAWRAHRRVSTPTRGPEATVSVPTRRNANVA